MWNSYIDRPETRVDTTATAGIATAITWAIRMNFLPSTYRPKAELALTGIKQYLTADGFVYQASQINRGGEALQANGYRVITQITLGLTTQLWAGLKSIK